MKVMPGTVVPPLGTRPGMVPFRKGMPMPGTVVPGGELSSGGELPATPEQLMEQLAFAQVLRGGK